jgi:hypothetical protein
LHNSGAKLASETRELQVGRYFRRSAGGIVSGSLSCGDRPVYVADSPGFDGKPNPQAGTGRLGEALSVRVEGMVSPLSSRTTTACVVPIAVVEDEG